MQLSGMIPTRGHASHMVWRRVSTLRVAGLKRFEVLQLSIFSYFLQDVANTIKCAATSHNARRRLLCAVVCSVTHPTSAMAPRTSVARKFMLQALSTCRIDAVGSVDLKCMAVLFCVCKVHSTA